MDSKNEIQLNSVWTEIAQGDAGSFERLFLMTSQELFNYGMYFTRDKEHILSTIQSLFVYIWEHKKTLNPNGHVKNYLLKAFRNTLLKKTRKADIQFMAPAFESSFEAHLIAEEESNAIKHSLQKALAALSDRQKEIIFLKYYAKKSTDEIAEIMGITPKASYKLLARALQTMRKEMGLLHFLLWII